MQVPDLNFDCLTIHFKEVSTDVLANFDNWPFGFAFFLLLLFKFLLLLMFYIYQ